MRPMGGDGSPEGHDRARVPLSSRGLRLLLGMLVIGLGVRLWLAFDTYGVQYDIDSFGIVRDQLAIGLDTVYDAFRWPYPPAFFAPIAASGWVSDVTGLPFHGVVQLPAIAADLAIAIIVQWWLRDRGHDERTALAGAGLVALGPSFIAISGYHGQIDSVAILPAIVGVLIWERGGARRAGWAGALIGLGAAVKTVPLMMVLALLPTSRSWGERLRLVVPAGMVPLVALTPFLVLDAHGTYSALKANQGVAGFGGLSGFVQPELTRFWSTLDGTVQASGALQALTDAQNVIVAAAVLAAAVVLALYRTKPLPAAVLIWLVVYAANPNFAYQYLIWGLPFFLLAGHIRAVALLQLAILPATLLLYAQTDIDSTGWMYWIAIQGVWLGIVFACAGYAYTLWSGPMPRWPGGPREAASSAPA